MNEIEKMCKKIDEMKAMLSKSDERNMDAHDKILDKLDAHKGTTNQHFIDQKDFCAKRHDKIGKEHPLTSTFWRVMGVFMVLIFGSFAYTSGVLAYIIKHISG